MFRKNSRIEKFQAKEVGSFTILSKIFCLTGPKNFVGESSSASLISGIEKC